MSEENFKCCLCDYATEIKYCYQRHLATKKHTEKINELILNTNKKNQNVPKKSQFVCEYCDNEFSKIGNLNRHQNTCVRKINLKNEMITNEKEKLREIEMLKRELSLKDQIIAREPKSDKIIKSNEIIKIENKYKCNHCDGLFISIPLIEEHVKVDCMHDLRYDDFYTYDKEKSGKFLFKNSANAGEIYIIQTDFDLHNVYKIGIAVNIENRMKNYRTGYSYEPKLRYYFPCKDIRNADNLIKNALTKYNVKREIYRGDIDEIKKIIMDTLMQVNDNIVYSYKPNVKINEICECAKCDKVFFTASDLIGHDKHYHTEEENVIHDPVYKCGFCNSVFKKSHGLARHNEKCIKKNSNDEVETLKNELRLREEKILFYESKFSNIIDKDTIAE